TIGADGLIYQDLRDMQQAVTDINPALARFEASCFDGQYITGDITPEYLERLGQARGSSRDEESAGGLQFNLGYRSNGSRRRGPPAPPGAVPGPAIRFTYHGLHHAYPWPAPVPAYRSAVLLQ